MLSATSLSIHSSGNQELCSPQTEYIHMIRQSPFLPLIRVYKPLWRYITGPLSTCVKEECKIRRIILWQVGWLKRGKIRKEYPVPGTYHNIF